MTTSVLLNDDPDDVKAKWIRKHGPDAGLESHATFRAYNEGNELICEVKFFVDDVRDRKFAATELLALINSHVPGTEEWYKAVYRNRGETLPEYLNDDGQWEIVTYE